MEDKGDMIDRALNPTAQQKRMAQLLVEGNLSVVDCYIDAYKQTGDQLLDRQKLASRAYMASKSKGCMYWIQLLQEQQAVEEARILVWDKRKAAQRLLKMCHEIEVNIDITRELRDRMLDENLSTSQQLSQMLKVSQVCNDTARAIKECIQEMNSMYGLTKPEVSTASAIQVIIGSPESLPEDTAD